MSQNNNNLHIIITNINDNKYLSNEITPSTYKFDSQKSSYQSPSFVLPLNSLEEGQWNQGKSDLLPSNLDNDNHNNISHDIYDKRRIESVLTLLGGGKYANIDGHGPYLPIKPPTKVLNKANNALDKLGSPKYPYI